MTDARIRAAGKRITEAKEGVFRAQDAASELGDPKLIEALRKARHALEAADRRRGQLQIEQNSN